MTTLEALQDRVSKTLSSDDLARAAKVSKDLAEIGDWHALNTIVDRLWHGKVSLSRVCRSLNGFPEGDKALIRKKQAPEGVRFRSVVTPYVLLHLEQNLARKIQSKTPTDITISFKR